MLLTVGFTDGSSELTQLQPVVLDLGKYHVRHQWDIGDHHRVFKLDLDKSVSVTHGAERVYFELSLAHPNLYESFLESLSSQKGYTTIARSVVAKAKLGQLKRLSIRYENRTRAIWVRLTARIRLQAPLVRTTDNRNITVEFATQLLDGSLRLDVRSLNISGVPGEIDRIIAKSIKPIDFQLSACLAEKSATLEQASFTEQDQALKIAVSLPTDEFMSAFWCLVRT